MPGTLRADAVVIGTGAGGGPAAAVLAESGRDVVVLEAGPRLAAADFTPNEAEMTSRLGTMRTTADAGESFYAGACVGGSTVVNDALCWRTPPEVLAAWRDEHGLDGLTDAAFAPWLDRAWRDVHAEPTERALWSRNAYRLELGAARLGWAGEAMPRNVRGCAGLGRCNLGCPIDAKQSALVTYVPRAERAGARVHADARADRIRIEAGAVRGVEATRLDPATRRPAGPLRVDAPLVCVAGGVLGSAALLRRSGIESAGRGLQVHSSLWVTARFDEPIHAYYGPTMAYSVTEFADVNGRAGPGYLLENVAARPVATASGLPGFGAEHERWMAQLPHLARCVVLLRDRTRGRVEIDRDGRARFDYALGPGDRARLHHGLESAARAYLAAGAREVALPLEGLAPLRGEADLARLADAQHGPFAFLYAVHLFGGAPMAARPDAGVCDERGACFGVRGLYVCDASSLPGNTGVNPQITVVANALRIAHGIADGGDTG